MATGKPPNLGQCVLINKKRLTSNFEFLKKKKKRAKQQAEKHKK